MINVVFDCLTAMEWGCSTSCRNKVVRLGEPSLAALKVLGADSEPVPGKILALADP
jgi:hypothetical protein